LVYQLFLGRSGNIYMKRPVLAFTSDKHLPALWIFVQIPAPALVPIDNQAALIRYCQPDQPILTFSGAAA